MKSRMRAIERISTRLRREATSGIERQGARSKRRPQGRARMRMSSRNEALKPAVDVDDVVGGGGARGGGRSGDAEAGLGRMDDGAVDGVDGAEACGDEDDVGAEARLGSKGAGFFAGAE